MNGLLNGMHQAIRPGAGMRVCCGPIFGSMVLEDTRHARPAFHNGMLAHFFVDASAMLHSTRTLCNALEILPIRMDDDDSHIQ